MEILIALALYVGLNFVGQCIAAGMALHKGMTPLEAKDWYREYQSL